MTRLPLAHLGHFIWTIYVVPFLIVVWSIFRSVREQRREKRRNNRR